jgi:hypothetical protein
MLFSLSKYLLSVISGVNFVHTVTGRASEYRLHATLTGFGGQGQGLLA